MPERERKRNYSSNTNYSETPGNELNESQEKFNDNQNVVTSSQHEENPVWELDFDYEQPTEQDTSLEDFKGAVAFPQDTFPNLQELYQLYLNKQHSHVLNFRRSVEFKTWMSESFEVFIPQMPSLSIRAMGDIIYRTDVSEKLFEMYQVIVLHRELCMSTDFTLVNGFSVTQFNTHNEGSRFTLSGYRSDGKATSLLIMIVLNMLDAQCFDCLVEHLRGSGFNMEYRKFAQVAYFVVPVEKGEKMFLYLFRNYCEKHTGTDSSRRRIKRIEFCDGVLYLISSSDDLSAMTVKHHVEWITDDAIPYVTRFMCSV